MKQVADNLELQDAISALLKDPSTIIITEIPSLNKKSVSSWISACIDFMKVNSKSLGSSPYVVELHARKSGKAALTAHKATAQLKAGFNIFKVNPDLKLVGYDTLQVLSSSAVSRHSRANGSALLHVINGTDFIVYANGIVVKEMNTSRLTMFAPGYKRTTRSAYDYELSVQEHYRNRVQFSQFCSHWHDRRKRILVGGRKTEDVFQENLLNWLSENLHDSKVVGKVNKLSKDQTDIEISHLQGDYFLLEVKWLGQNASGTKYSASRIGDGISQVENYLLRDQAVQEAALIVYDGRAVEDFRRLSCDREESDQWKQISKYKKQTLPVRGKAYVFFLENEDASRRKQR